MYGATGMAASVTHELADASTTATIGTSIHVFDPNRLVSEKTGPPSVLGHPLDGEIEKAKGPRSANPLVTGVLTSSPFDCDTSSPETNGFATPSCAKVPIGGSIRSAARGPSNGTACATTAALPDPTLAPLCTRDAHASVVTAYCGEYMVAKHAPDPTDNTNGRGLYTVMTPCATEAIADKVSAAEAIAAELSGAARIRSI